MPRYPGRDHYDRTERSIENRHSITCNIINQTKHTWYWEDFRLQEHSVFNNWQDSYGVKKQLQPGQSEKLAATTHQADHSGVEFWVTYNTDVGPIEFHFNNPFLGENSYHTYKLPSEFISVHDSNNAPGNWIGGDDPIFEWTIKQREPEPTSAPAPQGPDHFYTIDPNGDIASQSGYRLEGVAGYVYATQQPNTVPLYRYYFGPPTHDHFYTQSSNCEGLNHPMEKIECYLPASGDNGGVALHRWYGHNNHFYTTDPNGELVPARGYKQEGDAGFVYHTQVTNTVPLYRWLF